MGGWVGGWVGGGLRTGTAESLPRTNNGSAGPRSQQEQLSQTALLSRSAGVMPGIVMLREARLSRNEVGPSRLQASTPA